MGPQPTTIEHDVDVLKSRVDAICSSLNRIEADIKALKSSGIDWTWLAPCLPWLKSFAAWAFFYGGGYFTSHYGAPNVVTKEGPTTEKTIIEKHFVPTSKESPATVKSGDGPPKKE